MQVKIKIQCVWLMLILLTLTGFAFRSVVVPLGEHALLVTYTTFFGFPIIENQKLCYGKKCR